MKTERFGRDVNDDVFIVIQYRVAVQLAHRQYEELKISQTIKQKVTK